MANNKNTSNVEQLAGLVLGYIRFRAILILILIAGAIYYLNHGGDMFSKENMQRYQQEQQAQQQPIQQSYTPYTPPSNGQATLPDPGPPGAFNAPAPPR